MALAGDAEGNLRLIESLTGARLALRGMELQIGGAEGPAHRAFRLIGLLRPLWEPGDPLGAIEIQQALSAMDKIGRAHV